MLVGIVNFFSNIIVSKIGWIASFLLLSLPISVSAQMCMHVYVCVSARLCVCLCVVGQLNILKRITTFNSTIYSLLQFDINFISVLFKYDLCCFGQIC